MGLRAYWWVAAALILCGCPDDAEKPSDPEDQGVDGRVIVGDDMAVPDAADMGGGGDDDGVIDPDDGVDPDTGPDSDMTLPDQFVPPPDMFTGADIQTCEQACTRYAQCDRLADIFGDEANCLSTCERVAREGRPDDWFDCLEIEACNLVHRCPRPEVEPLECPELCEIAGECELDLPFDDCEGRCEDGGDPFRACGEHLFGQCGNDAFIGCLANEVYPQCEAMCGRAVACNILPPDSCVAECIGGLFDADALARTRVSQRNTCVGRQDEEDCVAIDLCIFPPDPGMVMPVPTEMAFCAAYDQCGFFFISCQEAYRNLATGDAIRCAMALMADQCPFDEFDLIDACDRGGGADPTVVACGALCEARDVCGLLEGERLGCSQDCVQGFQQGNDIAERLAGSLGCGNAARCDELVDCLDEASPRAECQVHCDALAGCELAAEDCVDACDPVWQRDRQEAFRECVSEAGEECDAMAACSVARPVPCGAACARQAECGLEEDEANCAALCDDAHFANAAAQAQEVACFLAAPACANAQDGSAFTVEGCNRDPAGGEECFGFCRALTEECSPDSEVDLVECVGDCGAGLAGDLGLRFSAAEPCLADLDIDGACEGVLACVPGEVNLDCDAYCDAAAACGVPRADCPQRCGEDPLSQLRVLEASRCLPEAGDDCDDIRECIDPPLRPIDGGGEINFDEAAFCLLWDGCFGAGCQAGVAQLQARGGIASLNCARDTLAQGRCPFDPAIIINDCSDVQGGPHPIADECERLCRAQAFCDADIDQAACQADCRGQLEVADPDSAARLAPRLLCATAWSCEDLGTCLENSAPDAVCERHCAALDGCGVAPEGCAATCDEGFARDRQFTWRDCVRRAGDDCDAVAACAPPPLLPCDRYCDRLDDCGLGAARCEQNCDDDHFAEPLQTALEVSCVLAARECADPDVLSVQDCQADPEAGGRACLAYCRGITECDPEAEGDVIECVNRCVNGFGDRDGLRFAASADCLEGIAVDAQCAPLRACLADELPIDCAAHCDRLDGCRIPAGGEGCAEACGEAPDADLQGCVVDALRVGSGCEGVAECVDYDPPRADIICTQFCGVRNDCDREVDPYLCRLDCTPTPEALPVQLGCALVSECADLDECLDLGPELNEDCADPCETQAICRVYPNEGLCNQACTGQAASPGARDDYVDSLGACLEDVVDGDECERDAAAECFNPSLCELTNDVIRIPANGGVVRTNNALRQDNYQGSCGGEGPEEVLAITIRVRAMVTFTMQNTDYDPLIWLRSACDDDNSEIACNDDANGLDSEVSAQLNPGTYFLFVDGFFGRAGNGEVRVTVNPI